MRIKVGCKEKPFSPWAFYILILLSIGSLLTWGFLGAENQEKKTREEKVRLAEEIVVMGKTPRETPLATVTRLGTKELQLSRPADLAEAIRQAPGVAVTVGGKNEFSLKLRGMDGQRITLLIDGVPVYEPFFATFDLKSLPVSGLDEVQITAGPSSTLYGPNTLGGVVNIITRRPASDPYLRLSASRGQLRTSAAGLEGAVATGRFGAAGSLNYQYSDGFYYFDGHNKERRALSDYERLNFNFKLVAYPSSRTEFLVSAGLYRSAFGIPPAVALVKPRYWRFRDWDRDILTAGGLYTPAERSHILWRAYWVRYNNTMEQYRDSSLQQLQAVSTYRNDLLGFFLLGETPLGRASALRASLSHRQETARIQDNAGLPFQFFRHHPTSLGLEVELSVSSLWRLVGGFSLDNLRKAGRSSLLRFNPMAGLVLAPAEDLSFRLALSQKSRFPTMHSLYSSLVGNPELQSERGTGLEAGVRWERGVSLRLTAFANRFRDMIDAIRLPDGTRRFRNLTSARINGLELDLRKSFSWVTFGLNANWLDHRNESENRPLDTLPERQARFFLEVRPLSRLQLAVVGLAASRSFWYDLSTRQLLTIPAYETADVLLTYQLASWQFSLKVSNVFNKFYYTEPGFPWRGRYIEAGLSVDIF